jgi:hypothetical protein
LATRAYGGAQEECEATGVAFAPGFINCVSAMPVAAFIVVKGNQPNAVTTFDPPVLSGTAASNAPLDGGIPSHITICFGSEVPPTTTTTTTTIPPTTAKPPVTTSPPPAPPAVGPPVPAPGAAAAVAVPVTPRVTG